MTYLLLYLAFHLVCAILGHGILFAYVQRQYPNIAEEDWREDMALSGTVHLLTGPLGLCATLVCTGFAKHGLLYRPSKR